MIYRDQLGDWRCDCEFGRVVRFFFFGDRKRFGGFVCPSCREERFVADERDKNLVCTCGSMVPVCIRWYRRMHHVGLGCQLHQRIEWDMDRPGAELHSVTSGIATVVEARRVDRPLLVDKGVS